MLELLNDGWNLIVTLLLSCWNILESIGSLVIIDDPFWRGVECTIIALLIWRNRKAIIAGVDSVPLLGGLVAKCLVVADELAETVLDAALGLWDLVRTNTWDRLVKFVKKTDDNLRG
jgi:hypothetical protein